MELNLELVDYNEICASLGRSEKLLIELRDKLRDWLKLQPHLPQDAPDRKLQWFILSSKFSLERGKSKLDMYYTIRSLVPELFANRDPRGPGITSLHDIIQFMVLPKLTPEKYRIIVCRATSKDPSKFCPWEFYKYFFMVGDVLMAEDCNAGLIFIVDFSMVSLAQIMKVTPAVVRKIEIASTEAYGANLKGCHLINASSFVDYIITMVKAVMKPKIAARLHVHSSNNLESLYQSVPKSIMPKEYGGDQPTMEELSDLCRKKVDQYRDWFLESEKILVNERLRPGPALDADSLFGFSGSFRKLDVD